MPEETIGAEQSASNPLTAFTGEIKRSGLSLPYTAGLLVVAFMMMLLPAIYMALIALTACGVVWYLFHAGVIFEGGGGGNGIGRLIIYLGPPVAGGILVFFMLKPFFGRRAKKTTPLSLDPAKEPLLFAFVERVCKLVGAPMPSRIDVDCQINASASLRRGLLSRDLVLTIGLPLAGGLSMREFAGVLAHEFGHFAQSAGMRLTYVIRHINFWFARVVFERDDWDRSLEQTAKRIDLRVGVILHSARGCIWLTRRILWALMHAGNAISCFMMRQMEFDADSYQAKTAGSETVESTMARLCVLNAATQIAIEDVRSGWASHRLPENLPLLIDHKARFLPEDVRQKLLATGNSKKTRWFDTHPCDADRINAVRALGEPGVFRVEESATGLFSDFAAVGKAVTRYRYEKEWKLDFTDQNLVSSEEMLRESTVNTEADAAIRRFYGNVNISLVPLLRENAPPQDELFASAKQRWQEAREQVEQLKAGAEKVSQECAALQPKLAGLTTARWLTAAGFKIKPEQFGLPEWTSATQAKLEMAASSGENELATHYEKEVQKLEEFVAALRTRVLSAVRLAPGEASQNTDEAPALETVITALTAVAGTLPILRQIGRRLAAFVALARNRGNHSNPSIVDGKLGALGTEMNAFLGAVQSSVRGIPYPFPHPRGQMTIAEYAHYEKPCNNALEGVYRNCEAHLDRMFALHYRLLGRLLVAAERAEKFLEKESSPS